MKPPTIYHLSATAVGVTLSLLAMGDADAYTFSRIFDDSGPYNFSYNLPAINNQGNVAFTATLDSDQWPLNNASWGHDYWRDIILIGNGESITQITPHRDFFYVTDINDSNTIALGTFESSPRCPINVLLTSNGEPFTTITKSEDCLTQHSAFSNSAINNDGIVLYQGVLSENGIFTSDGVNRKIIAESSGGNFAINNNGYVAFTTLFDAGNSGIFIGNGDTQPIRIADTNDIFSSFGTLSLNDSDTKDFDTLAFVASLDDDESQGIFTFSSENGSFSSIADTSGAFSSFSGLAINNNDAVAFGALLDTGEYGIFTGTDPVADKVIAVGDELFGSTVTSVGFSNKGFNDADQFAFFAKLADGSSGIFRADPDPNAVVLDWGGTLTKPIPATLKPIEIDNFSEQETLIDYASNGYWHQSIPPAYIVNGIVHIGYLGDSGYSQDILQTNNINPPDIKFGHWSGSFDDQLSVIFPEPQNRLGFGFALSQYDDFYWDAPIDKTFEEDAVTVKLFDAAENFLGTLSGEASQDPWFLGGFFGVESTVPFLRAEITFKEGYQNFALDNLRYEFVTLSEPATVPEPSTGLGLLVMSAIGAGSALRRKQK